MTEYMRPVTANGEPEARATFTGCGEGRIGGAQLLHLSFGTACRLEYPRASQFCCVGRLGDEARAACAMRARRYLPVLRFRGRDLLFGLVRDVVSSDYDILTP